MKKNLLLLTAVIVFTYNSFAQSITFGVKAGANFSSLSVTDGASDFTINSGTLTSFNAGVFADFKFNHISIQPALNYTGKGGTFSQTEDDASAKVTEKLNYLQLPVTALYHVPVKVGEIYFGLGPYIAYGLSGTVKVSESSGGETQNDSQSIKFGSGDDASAKRTDFGATGQAGIKFKSGFLININYDLGLSNVANNDSSEGTLKTRVFGVSVGYSF